MLLNQFRLRKAASRTFINSFYASHFTGYRMRFAARYHKIIFPAARTFISANGNTNPKAEQEVKKIQIKARGGA
jgi:hypothetical protein